MKCAFVLFDRMTALDLVGFYDPVTRLESMRILEDFEWKLCATRRAVVDDRGMRIEADVVLESLGSYDMVFVPGGLGTRSLQHDLHFLEWLKTAEPVTLKVSVCTGALLLGAVGFLRGRRATTHPSAYAELEPYCAAVVRARVVDEGDVIMRRAFHRQSTLACTWWSAWLAPRHGLESQLRWTIPPATQCRLL
jgi:transcriptional regulator GlxA family with amidase domain